MASFALVWCPLGEIYMHMTARLSLVVFLVAFLVSCYSTEGAENVVRWPGRAAAVYMGLASWPQEAAQVEVVMRGRVDSIDYRQPDFDSPSYAWKGTVREGVDSGHWTTLHLVNPYDEDEELGLSIHWPDRPQTLYSPQILSISFAVTTGDDGTVDVAGDIRQDDGALVLRLAEGHFETPAEKACDGSDSCPTHARCIEGACRAWPLECGAPMPAPACTTGLDEEACEAAGGSFTQEQGFGLYDVCLCPTADSGCPCWLRGHCQGRCEAPALSGCMDVQMGTCSSDRRRLRLGCHCDAWEEGFTAYCAD